MGTQTEFNIGEFNDFFDKLNKAASYDFNKELAVWIQGLGAEFLKIIEDEIIDLKVMDTRLLLASFHEGGDGNVYKITDGGLTLEVGTNVSYASYVNDGHWANPQGVKTRFVPGRWEGKRFIYDPNEKKSGMVLKQQWIEGTHYWDSAVNILERFMPFFLENKMQEWLDKYFE